MIMWDLMGVWPSGKLFCYGVDGLNFETDDEFLFKMVIVYPLVI